MKNIWQVMAGVVLLGVLGGVSHASVDIAYGNGALKGCYGFLSTSVDVPAPNNRSTVGTICFDGVGSILPGVPGADLTGWMQTTNGVPVAFANVPGRYAVTNVPGQGMGQFIVTPSSGTCEYAFSINSVDAAGLAHGFQFSLIKCAGSTNVVGGTAYLQP